jgi:hypothetical protein
MKLKPSYKILIVIMLIAIVFLWASRKRVSLAYQNTYEGQLFKSVAYVSSVMYYRLPDTFNLYNNNFTEQEGILFQNSLDNIVYTLEYQGKEIKRVEYFRGEDYNLSQSVKNFYNIMFEVKEKSKEIDEGVFQQISDIVHKYGKTLSDINEKSAENVFEKSPNTINSATMEIQDLMKLYK